MSDKVVKRVGILGGAFNPPHIGHIDICRFVFGRGDCDQLWVIPCYQHPFGKPMVSFEDRLTMCRFTFQEFGEKVWVTDVERRLGGVSHTVRTLEHLKFKYPDKKFALIVGSDISNEKEQWKQFDKIEKLATIIEVPRGDASPIANVSSTEIRRKITVGEKFDDDVPVPVAVYIVTHGLYHG